MFAQFPGQGASLGVAGGVPCPFLLLETLDQYARHPLDGLTMMGPAAMHWTSSQILAKYPRGLRTERARLDPVEQLAVDRYGRELAAAVGSFFRDVDIAVRTWPCYQNRFLFNIALVERRALFQPLMLNPRDVPVGADEPWCRRQVHIGPEDQRINMFYDGSITPTRSPLAISFLEPGYDRALAHLERALTDLSAAAGPAMPESLRAEIRVNVFRCLLTTLGHAVRMQGLWLKLEDLEAQQRPEGAEALADCRLEIRRTISRECANTRRLISLLQRLPCVLQWGTLEEAESRTGGSLLLLLQHKVDLMEGDLARHIVTRAP